MATLKSPDIAWFLTKSRSARQVNDSSSPTNERGLRLAFLSMFVLLRMALGAISPPPATANDLDKWALKQTRICIGGVIKLVNIPHGSLTTADTIITSRPEPKLFRIQFSSKDAELSLHQSGTENCEGNELLREKVSYAFIRGTADFESIPLKPDSILMLNIQIPAYNEWLIDDIGGLWIELQQAQTQLTQGGSINQRVDLFLTNSSNLDFSAGSRDNPSTLFLSSNWIELNSVVGLFSNPQNRKPLRVEAETSQSRPRHKSRRAEGTPAVIQNSKDHKITVELDLNTGNKRIFNTSFSPFNVQKSTPPNEAETVIGQLGLSYRDWSANLELEFHNGRATAKLENLKMDIINASYLPAEATKIKSSNVGKLEVEPSLGEAAIDLIPFRISNLLIDAEYLEINSDMKVVGSGGMIVDRAEIGEQEGKLVFDQAQIVQVPPNEAQGVSATVKDFTISLSSSASGLQSKLAGELFRIKIGAFSWTAAEKATEGQPSTLNGELKDSNYLLTASLQGGDFELSESGNCSLKALLHSASIEAAYTPKTNRLKILEGGQPLTLTKFRSLCELPNWLQVADQGDGQETPPGTTSNIVADCQPGLNQNEEHCPVVISFSTPLNTCVKKKGKDECEPLALENRFIANIYANGKSTQVTLTSESIEKSFNELLSLEIDSTTFDQVAQIKIGKIVAKGSLWKRQLAATATAIEMNTSTISHTRFPEFRGQPTKDVKFRELHGTLYLRDADLFGELSFSKIGEPCYHLDGRFVTPDGLEIKSSAITISNPFDASNTDAININIVNGTTTTAGNYELNFQNINFDSSSQEARAAGNFTLDQFQLSTSVKISAGNDCPSLPAFIIATTQGTGALRIESGETIFDPEVATISLATSTWKCEISKPFTKVEFLNFRGVPTYKMETPVSASHIFKLDPLKLSAQGRTLSMRPKNKDLAFCIPTEDSNIPALIESQWRVSDGKTGEENIQDINDSIDFDNAHSRMMKGIEKALQKWESTHEILGLARSADPFRACD